MMYGAEALGGEARPEAFEGGGGGGLIQSKSSEQGTGGGGGGSVEGYEETGFCLNGQTCNSQEYIYLQLL